MEDSENICLACGLCCDGTVIGFVQLSREETSVLKELMVIENPNGAGCFLQPCTNFCESCTIYPNRPKECASFKCGLLRSFEQNEMDFDTAAATIDLVKQKRIAIERKLALTQLKLQSPSFYFKMAELKKLFQENKSETYLTQNHLDLRTDLKELEILLSKKFDVSIL